ncbi:MAG: rhodanese-related sulfurtransferase [Pseudomonadota bacterium]
MTYVIATFYHFFDFANHAAEKPALLQKMLQLDIKGSILVAPEGFNGTVSGSRDAIDTLLQFLKDSIAKSDFEHKESLASTKPFGRAKVRLKKETISLGEPTEIENIGSYVEPENWNDLIADPDVVLIDARNDYEVALGTFENAVNPQTRGFKQLPDFARQLLDGDKNKKIATFCTGGIRCEKFTSWLVGEGYKNVFHLKGGILKYLEDIPVSETKWRGECYVFDDRVAVDHDLQPTKKFHLCSNCGDPLQAKQRLCAACSTAAAQAN